MDCVFRGMCRRKKKKIGFGLGKMKSFSTNMEAAATATVSHQRSLITKTVATCFSFNGRDLILTCVPLPKAAD